MRITPQGWLEDRVTDDSKPVGPVEYELSTIQLIDATADASIAFARIAQRASLLLGSESID